MIGIFLLVFDGKPDDKKKNSNKTKHEDARQRCEGDRMKKRKMGKREKKDMKL